jgi:cardiolipin synthase
VFNRFVPLLSAVQNFRDHRKIVAIDGKIAYTGGLNIADEYINKTHPFGHWKDAGVRIEGEGAFSFSFMFLKMWMLAGHEESDLSLYLPEKCQTESAEMTDGFVQPYASEPLASKNVSEEVYMQIISKATKYVYIQTPYLIIDNSMISALTVAAKSGVDIRVMTPYHWDKRFVHFMTRSYYRELLRAGIKIYEYTPGFIHSKNVISDDACAVVGTINLDYRSLYHHFENAVYFKDRGVVAQVKQDFEQTFSVSRECSSEYPKRGILGKLFDSILRVFETLM